MRVERIYSTYTDIHQPTLQKYKENEREKASVYNEHQTRTSGVLKTTIEKSHVIKVIFINSKIKYIHC